MQQNFNVIIADTTCFIILDKIGEMELLKLVFNNIVTTSIIAEEFGQPLPAWVEIKDVQNIQLLNALKIEVDRGEASAIALAIELSPAFIILDDLEARDLAKQLDLDYTGTFGLLLRAKRTGHIKAIKPLMAKIKMTNFWISERLYRDILNQANEL